MAKQKILKIKIGEIYLGGKTIPVMQTAFQKKSRDGNFYYMISNPVFVQEIEVENKQNKNSIEA
jgi:hypothetical protein